MGTTTITYTYNKDLRIPIKTLIEEIEYGCTFALYHNHETIIPCSGHKLKWIQWEINESQLFIIVDDNFWHEEFFFEKFLTIFVYNFLDFGKITLQHIDLSQSILKYYIQLTEPLTIPQGRYLTGTIFKPYYHLPLDKKIKQAQSFIEEGINILKNDECFFETKSGIIKEVKTLTKIVEGKAFYVPNITSYINDDTFINILMENGIEICMVDYLVAGFRQICLLKKKHPNLKIWGHRIGYSVLQNYISMQAISVLGLLSGIDLMHIGTPTDLTQKQYDMVSELWSLKPTFIPIFTKTTPEIINTILPIFDNKAIYMACGYFRTNDGNINWSFVREWCDLFQ